jgi:hypothetical protein
MNKTHYEVLGVEKTASTAEIKTAFLQLTKKVRLCPRGKVNPVARKTMTTSREYLLTDLPLVNILEVFSGKV